MDYFKFKNKQAYCEDVPLADLAKAYGTPLYVYSRATLLRHCERLLSAFREYPTLACFAVKANGNLRFLQEVFQQGLGADLVSGGELARALAAGVKTDRIVFSGVGKREDEIRQALQSGLLSFNVESVFELQDIARIAADMKKVAPVALRINPDIDAQTNPKIATGMHTSKFGMTESDAKELISQLKSLPQVKLVGLACHIGSQVTNLDPLREAAGRMAAFAKELLENGLPLEFIDMGGGLGIRYKHEQPPELEAYAKTLIEQIKPTGLRLVIEPGRVIAGNTGVLLSRVIGLKSTSKKNFLIIDGSMTELMRPAFYGSYHEILAGSEFQDRPTDVYDVVGSVCESSDVLGTDRTLPSLQQGELVFIRGCGGYASSMASNYNARPRPAEVMVDGDQVIEVRKRESIASLFELEQAGLKR